jgi:group I intron endonuclease
MSEEKRTIGIYAIVNMIDGKKYIGQSVDIKTRNRKELRKLKNGYFTNQHLQNAFNKYGEENFIFIFLEECSKEKLNEREIYHIAAAGWPDHDLCYNITRGGTGGDTLSNHPNKTEICEKMSESRSGENNPMYNKNHTEESIEKMKGPRPSKQGIKRPEHSDFMIKLWEDPEYRLNKSDQSGENNPASKLTVRKVLTIRILLRNLTHRGAIQEIAAIYGVHPSTIRNIKNGKSWKDVTCKGWNR